MSSAINPANPTAVNATTQSVRDNFTAAKNEIEALQAYVSGTAVSQSAQILAARSMGQFMVLARSAVSVVAPSDTNENILATVTVPAGALGANGALRISTSWTVTNSGNSKTFRVRYSGGAGTAFWSSVQTAIATLAQMMLIQNRGSTNSQINATQPSLNGSTFGISTGALTTGSIDTTAATTIAITAQKGSAGETMTLESYLVELLPT